MEHIDNYLHDLATLLERFDRGAMEQIIHALEETRRRGGRVFAFGNGGSAALANHFACDLGKNATREDTGRFCIQSLNENMSCITAYANDCGYDVVFFEQLKNYIIGPLDAIFAISSSGNSPNIVRACAYAREKGSLVLGLAGFTGGGLKELSDICLHIPCMEYEKVEDAHSVATHIIVSYFKGQSGGKQ